MTPFDVYPLLNIEPVLAHGCTITDSNGIDYLDLYGGHAVISIGHSHPHYIERLENQLHKIGFYSNMVQNSLQKELAQKLGNMSGYPDWSLFLCNSGAEANENALKLAAFYTGRTKVLAFTNAFHGRTAGSVACTDNHKIRSPFSLSSESVTFVPLNDIEFVEKALSTHQYAAVIIEGIQGVAGIVMPNNHFFHDLRRVCTQTQTLLVLDEVQSGYGRTGAFFAHQHSGIQPDLITIAKGMGNGFPIGGVLISPCMKAIHGQLGTTFGGNHLSCVAALAVLEVIEAESLISNAQKVGEYLLDQLSPLCADVPGTTSVHSSTQSPSISGIRGKGLMIGFEAPFQYTFLRNDLLFKEHIFVGTAGTHTIRLLPPLCLSLLQAQQFITSLTSLLDNNKLLTTNQQFSTLN